MQGWVKLHRCLLGKAIWHNSTPEQKTILITLLMMANHEEREWEWEGLKYKAQPGQFVTSINSIQKACGKGISKQNVRTALLKFKKYEFLTYESTKTGRLITIVNWGQYQQLNDKANIDTNKELTKSQQRANKELTPNKNVKNDKNVKNERKVQYAEFVKMTPEEYQKLIDQFGKHATNRMIEILDNYKGSKGKTYKCDYRAILSWVTKRYQEEAQNGKDKQHTEKPKDMAGKFRKFVSS